MGDNKKLFFDVDASTLKIKEILKKDFLELSMKAISDAKPNRNGSWFTLDSLNKGKETFKNKPILGFFKQNDFVSHNGQWKKDTELNLDYWDTLGEGERALGIIRESDDIDVIEDEDGLHWITLSCALWTQYSYKQVKRLLKDAIKAQKKGGPTKNISVEVNVLDYEEIIDPDSGQTIMQINDFELIGITILGSRNGVPVEPGIEGAELSVLDVVNQENFGKQLNKVRLAYEKLDQTKNIEEQKENTEMDKDKKNFETAEEEVVKEENPVVEEEVKKEETSENKKDFEGQTGADENKEENPTVETSTVEVNNTTYEINKEETPKEEVVVVKENTPEEGNPEDNKKFEVEDPTYDLAYRVEHLKSEVNCLDWSIKYYSQEGVIGGERVINFLKKQRAIMASLLKETASLLDAVVQESYEEVEYKEEDRMEDSDIENYFTKDDSEGLKGLFSEISKLSKENEELVASKNELENTNKELSEKFESISKENEDFKLKDLLAKAETFAIKGDLSEEQSNAIMEGCKSGKYINEEAVKTAVALISFEAKESNVKEKTIYEAEISDTPTPKAGTDHAEKSVKKSCWEKINDYCGK